MPGARERVAAAEANDSEKLFRIAEAIHTENRTSKVCNAFTDACAHVAALFRGRWHSPADE